VRSSHGVGVIGVARNAPPAVGAWEAELESALVRQPGGEILTADQTARLPQFQLGLLKYPGQGLLCSHIAMRIHAVHMNTFLCQAIPAVVTFIMDSASLSGSRLGSPIHSLDGHGKRETMTHRFHIVDVFAERPYSGNQLAVVIGAEALSDETMQQLAAETNYSETTFVTPEPEDDGGYRVRIFTPAREIAFAGHPILGTAWVLRHHVAPEDPGPVRLNIAVGQIPVSFESSAEGGEMAWFLAPPASLGASCAREPFATALGISPDDIATESPIQQITAGISAMIVPLRSLDALRRSKLDLDAYSPLAAQGLPPLVYLFCRQTHHPQNDLCARFFFEAHGVREDPATGNGAAFLGAYLLEYGLLGGADLSLRIEQGYEVRRPSLVMLRARMVSGSREISVGGRVVPTMRGELL
jgi:trans-2,3-dihydro-3-hydroxyanthranilate isomerase